MSSQLEHSGVFLWPHRAGAILNHLWAQRAPGAYIKNQSRLLGSLLHKPGRDPKATQGKTDYNHVRLKD